jgi:hypothetical protein
MVTPVILLNWHLAPRARLRVRFKPRRVDVLQRPTAVPTALLSTARHLGHLEPKIALRARRWAVRLARAREAELKRARAAHVDAAQSQRG